MLLYNSHKQLLLLFRVSRTRRTFSARTGRPRWSSCGPVWPLSPVVPLTDTPRRNWWNSCPAVPSTVTTTSTCSLSQLYSPYRNTTLPSGRTSSRVNVAYGVFEPLQMCRLIVSFSISIYSLAGVVNFILREVPDSCPLILDMGIRMLIVLLTHWRELLSAPPPQDRTRPSPNLPPPPLKRTSWRSDRWRR